MTSQRSIIIFNHAISSEATKKCYLNELKRFKEFYKIRDYDSLTTIEPKKLNIMIEDWKLQTKRINPLLIWYYKLRKRQRTKAVCSNCSKQFLILSCWYDKIKDAKCPYCLEEDFDEYDD